MTCHFDAVEYINDLEAVGVSHSQAKAHANALRRAFGRLAGKCDVEELGARLMRGFEALKAASEQRFHALEARLDRVEARLNVIEAQLAALMSEVRMHRWALGFLGALQVATFAKVLML